MPSLQCILLNASSLFFIFIVSLPFLFSFFPYVLWKNKKTTAITSSIFKKKKKKFNLSLFGVLFFVFVFQKPYTHSQSCSSDVTKARSYNKGVANILPSPPHPPLVKRKGHCASSAYTQFPSIQSGDPWERTGMSGCLWGAYRMGGGGRISATPPVISLLRLLHTHCASKRNPIWKATQSHPSAITKAAAPMTFSEMLPVPGIPKLIWEPCWSSKPEMKLVSTLKIYQGCWKLLDFWQSHLPVRKETSSRPAETKAFLCLIHRPLT